MYHCWNTTTCAADESIFFHLMYLNQVNYMVHLPSIYLLSDSAQILDAIVIFIKVMQWLGIPYFQGFFKLNHRAKWCAMLISYEQVFLYDSHAYWHHSHTQYISMCLQNVFTPNKAGGKNGGRSKKNKAKKPQPHKILKIHNHGVQTYLLDNFKSSNPPAKIIVSIGLKHIVLLQTKCITVSQLVTYMYLCVHLLIMTEINKKKVIIFKYLLNTKTSLKLLKHSVACGIHILNNN